KGVAEEGVALPAFPAGDHDAQRSSEATARTVLVLERAAALLGDRFEGVCLALVPKQVTDASGWRASIAMLDRARLSSRASISVSAAPGGPLEGTLSAHGADLRVDEDELKDYLRRRSPRAGDAAEPAMKLQRLLLDAAAHAAAGEHAAAAALYCEA